MILTLKIRNMLRINKINSRTQTDQEDQVDLAVQVVNQVTLNNNLDKATLK